MFHAVQALNVQLPVVAGFLAGAEGANDVGEQSARFIGEGGSFLQHAGVTGIEDGKVTVFGTGFEQQLTALGAQFALHAGHACSRSSLRFIGQHLAATEQGQQGDKQQRRGGTHRANSRVSTERCRHVTQAGR
ncbi:hypothetical protein D3C72_1309950 [compost metagenome]